MKTIKYIFILLLLLGPTIDCFGDQQPVTAEQLQEEQETATRDVVERNNKFALELYGKLRVREGNLFFSPYSISTALAMAYEGARGQTQDQIARVLHFPITGDADNELSRRVTSWDPRAFTGTFGKVIRDLNNRGKKGNYQLHVANALWGQKGYEFLEEFLQLVEAKYDGRLKEVDFVGATEAARNIINAWVEQKTNDKIKDLISRGALDRMTRLVLTNAIYFKGNWERQFKEDRTKNAPFTLLSGENVDVPMMNQKAEFKYMETEDIQVLELPYVDDELSMVILLPKEFDGLPEFEKGLTTDNLAGWLGKLHKREVIVSVPKFKMTSQFGLASVLKSMGMMDAFSPGRADFSGINGKKDLFISAVIHKAYVDVNEEGTEAAAATAVTMKVTSIGPTRIPVFRADHPFLFLIRDNLSGSVLFIGRVMDPRA
jgi:serpin B